MFKFMKNKDGEIVIELGKTYRDKVHGVSGVATSHARYITGCDRVCLEFVKDGDVKEFWVDVNRLEGVEIPLAQQKTGGPQKRAPEKKAG